MSGRRQVDDGTRCVEDTPTSPIVVTPLGGPAWAARLRATLRRLVPGGWVAARVDPGRPGATALALVAAVAATAAAIGVWAERPRAEPVATLPALAAPAPQDGGSSAGSGAPGGLATAAEPAPLVVSVVGKVRSPGLVRVPDGARVADVLEAAGGALPGVDLSGLNLARRVGDGEQVAVGVAAAPDAAPAASRGGPDSPGRAAGASPGGTGPVDLNRATLAQLDALPGVGPVTAQRILEWRTSHGRFGRVEQLREIEGIGERRFAQLRELVTVS